MRLAMYQDCLLKVCNKFLLRRQQWGISVSELARRCNVDKKRLRYVLDGQREMRVDEFLKLCVALKLDPRSFITREVVEEVAEATRRSIGRYDDLCL